MTIEVDCIGYQAFYKVFRDAIIDRELNGKFDKGRGVNSPQIWHETYPRTKKYIVLEIVKYSVKNKYYFYKMKGELDPRKGSVGNVNASALYYALEYIGIRLPKDIIVDGFTPHSFLADVLFEEFKKQYLVGTTFKPKKNKYLSAVEITEGARNPVLNIDEIKVQSNMFGVFSGTIKQGQCTDKCEVQLFSSNGIDITGKIVIDYEADDFADAVRETILLEGKFLYNRFISLVYRNHHPHVTQCGVVFLELSSFRDILFGEFMGYYSPKSPKRGDCKGILTLKKIDNNILMPRLDSNS
ncbi:MAG TPA: hypothetical protein VD993_15400 [Chitinophagaceae bacterium]|nr:hypothetical protein [Chitinophagaceae bacterium]